MPRRQWWCSLKFIIWKRLNCSETSWIISSSPGCFSSTPEASLDIGHQHRVHDFFGASVLPSDVFARSTLIFCTCLDTATGFFASMFVLHNRTRHFAGESYVYLIFRWHRVGRGSNGNSVGEVSCSMLQRKGMKGFYKHATSPFYRARRRE